jgi:hypothetical protein
MGGVLASGIGLERHPRGDAERRLDAEYVPDRDPGFLNISELRA